MVNSHLSQPAAVRGAPVADCRAVVLMVHGRNQTSDDMLALADKINVGHVHYVAPQANGNSWYPYGFMEEISKNEPYVSDALACMDMRIADVVNAGVPRSNIVLLGFSQGACLLAEYAVRHPDRYGAIILYTGGLIGPAGTSWKTEGSFRKTPVFMGSSDIDSWVPEVRVLETAAIYKKMDAEVTLRIYKGMDHIVNDEEIAFAQNMIGDLLR